MFVAVPRFSTFSFSGLYALDKSRELGLPESTNWRVYSVRDVEVSEDFARLYPYEFEYSNGK